MTSTVYLNGQYLKKEEARLSVDDRGFIFGDGVYEVTRAIQGKLFEWGRHARRLKNSLEQMGLKPEISMEELEKISLTLLEKNKLTAEATVYLQITRGAAFPRSFPFPSSKTPCTVYLCASAFAPPHDLRKTGAKAITVPDIRWSRCDLKTVNLIPAVLAKQRAVEAGAFEAIFVRDGVITEGAYSNAFAVQNGVIRTYPACNFILSGVTRDVVIEIIREMQLPYEERPLLLSEAGHFQEFFITSTGNDVLPIVELDGKKVGAGAPGSIARKLYEVLARRMYGKGLTLAA